MAKLHFLTILSILGEVRRSSSISWNGPLVTKTSLVNPIALKPTPPPNASAIDGNLMRSPQLCGFVNGHLRSPIRCLPRSHCVSRDDAVACCPRNNIKGCRNLYTACVNSRGACDGRFCPYDFQVLTCYRPSKPYCVDYNFINGQHMFSCGSESSITYDIYPANKVTQYPMTNTTRCFESTSTKLISPTAHAKNRSDDLSNSTSLNFPMNKTKIGNYRLNLNTSTDISEKLWEKIRMIIFRLAFGLREKQRELDRQANYSNYTKQKGVGAEADNSVLKISTVRSTVSTGILHSFPTDLSRTLCNQSQNSTKNSKDLLTNGKVPATSLTQQSLIVNSSASKTKDMSQQSTISSRLFDPAPSMNRSISVETSAPIGGELRSKHQQNSTAITGNDTNVSSSNATSEPQQGEIKVSHLKSQFTSSSQSERNTKHSDWVRFDTNHRTPNNNSGEFYYSGLNKCEGCKSALKNLVWDSQTERTDAEP